MESLITFLKIFLYIYLGSFTYITYQIIFYFHKRFLLIKTFSFFFILALLLIKISSKYNIIFFIGYIFFYFIGIYISKLVFKDKIHKNTKLVKHFVIIPFKKQIINFLKIIVFYDQFLNIRKHIKLYFYYRKYPHKKPKSIYELF